MERGLAYFLAIRSRLSAHVRHGEDEERIVRRLGHAISDGEDRPGLARDARFLLHIALDGLDNRLARLDVSRRERPEAFRRAIRLADHEELSVADQEGARADRDRERRNVEGHDPVRSPNEMALSQVSFLGRLGAPWHGRSRSPRGASSSESGSSGTSTCPPTAGCSPSPRTRETSGPSTSWTFGRRRIGSSWSPSSPS